MPAEHEAAGSIPARRTTLIVAADFEFSRSACYFQTSLFSDARYDFQSPLASAIVQLAQLQTR
jgi:hypothetical protein